MWWLMCVDSAGPIWTPKMMSIVEKFRLHNFKNLRDLLFVALGLVEAENKVPIANITIGGRYLMQRGLKPLKVTWAIVCQTQAIPWVNFQICIQQTNWYGLLWHMGHVEYENILWMSELLYLETWIAHSMKRPASFVYVAFLYCHKYFLWFSLNLCPASWLAVFVYLSRYTSSEVETFLYALTFEDVDATVMVDNLTPISLQSRQSQARKSSWIDWIERIERIRNVIKSHEVWARL